MRKLLTLLFLSTFAVAASAGDGIINVARKVNTYFMEKTPDPTAATNVKRVRPSSLWTRAVYYEGLMALYGLDPDGRYIEYTDRWADFHKWTPRNGITTTHADDQCCAQTYIDRFFMTGDKKCIEQVGRNLDLQMASGRVDYWTWIDAIQMAMPVYSKYYKATGKRRYIDYAMKAYTWCRDTCGGGLFNEDEGLWWRDKDYVPPYKESDGRNCYWSRGNGWVYAALARVMSDLDAADPYYAKLAADFKLMSRALVECQRTDGYWNVSLVSPVTYGGPEMTGTALFLYGMSWGILNGLLDEQTYRPVCDMAWRALEACVHDDGFLGYNQGTGKDPSAGQPVTYTSVPDFEDYGTGCFLLGAVWYHKLVTAKPSALAAWPVARNEAKAGTRWWWPGSAVDGEGIAWNLSQFAEAGIGTVEITPIYGVQGNEDKELPFLSPQWMDALKAVNAVADSLGIEVDMNCGTGWPFGGPQVGVADAACKAVFADTLVSAQSAGLQGVCPQLRDKRAKHAVLQCKRAFPTGRKDTFRIIAVYAVPTGQRVKRAAPGGEGYVVDHFDSLAVARYLARIDSAFAASGVRVPAAFFNDSYEVYGANWTRNLFGEFAKRRGYRLEDRLPELLGYADDGGETLADYRETLSDLLYENFTRQWTAWAHRQGADTRSQAHGSPANLLDLYAAVDVPETEGFGLSDFGIRGLRTDKGFTRANYSDVSMLKYASSAAHVAGLRFASSETLTWLTEHFRTSLSQMKPELDLMFTCGINRVLFHGSCYSPKEEPWPGWRFYASVDMTPYNSVWRDAPFMMKYIERCQSFLQWGRADNDFLVYLPVRQMWKKRHKGGAAGLLMMFDIHSMGEKAPAFISSVLAIDGMGYDCDYISDRRLAEVEVLKGRLVTRGGGSYKGIIIPTGTPIDSAIAATLKRLAPYVVYGEDSVAMSRLARPELMRAGSGLRAVRREVADGHCYFIANLSPNDIDACYPLAVGFANAMWFNPMDGSICRAQISGDSLRISLRSGESAILRTYTSPIVPIPPIAPISPTAPTQSIPLSEKWTLDILDTTYTLDTLQTWETLSPETATYMGTATYTTHVNLTPGQAAHDWQIELGDVRESARVYINGRFIGCAWAVPFVLDCAGALHSGDNEIRIEVTNLPANRIADYDRRNIPWRKMKDINVVDINYKKTTYAGWQPMESGLNQRIELRTKVNN